MSADSEQNKKGKNILPLIDIPSSLIASSQNPVEPPSPPEPVAETSTPEQAELNSPLPIEDKQTEPVPPTKAEIEGHLLDPLTTELGDQPSSNSQLRDLLDQIPGRQIAKMGHQDIGTDEREPFPFLALIGQEEMKLALMLAMINPSVGGVLLIGPRGTGKTTAVRAVTDLLPTIHRSLCPEGCTELILAEKGMDGVCQSCREKVGYGKPISYSDRVRLVELPLNARLEDVVGGVNERIALEQKRVRLERGILAKADQNLLYIDEVNLLDNDVANAILDAAAQAKYTVRRGPLKLTYRAQFLLIGSMNPEEGNLRPQIMDRFGLRAIVHGLTDLELRYQVYEQATRYKQDPESLSASYAEKTLELAEEVNQAKKLLPQVVVGDAAKKLGLQLVSDMQIFSNRSEITLFEAARARAASALRTTVLPEDIEAVAPLALRLRKSAALAQFFDETAAEDTAIKTFINKYK